MFHRFLMIVSMIMMLAAPSFARDYVEVQQYNTPSQTYQASASQGRSSLTPVGLRTAPSFYQTTQQVQRAVQTRSFNRQQIGFQNVQATSSQNRLRKTTSSSWE